MPPVSRRRLLCASVGGAAAFLASRSFLLSPATRISRTAHALGSQIAITANCTDERQANAAIDAALAEIDAVEDALSLYRPHSDLCRLNRAGVLRDPDPRLVMVLRCAAEMSAASSGAFDVTVQPLWDAYASAARTGRLPDEKKLAAAQAAVDWRRVEVSRDEIRLTDRRTQVTLNGIAQGFAADRATAVLREHGIEHALIDTGELVARGRGPQAPWQVGIQHPEVADAFLALARLENRALATSGDYATTFGGDRRYNHLLDPTTGRSPSELASVSIAAPTAMEADALSTACFVLGVAGALALLQSRADCDGLLVTKTGRTIATAGFPQVSEEGTHV